MSEKTFSPVIQPDLRAARFAYLEVARTIALRLGRSGKPITVNDVRKVVGAPPSEIDPRVMGAIFRTQDWEKVDYASTDRRECHGRPVARFRRVFT